MEKRYYIGTSKPTENVKQLRNIKQKLTDIGIIDESTPDDMIPQAIEDGLKESGEAVENIKDVKQALVDKGLVDKNTPDNELDDVINDLKIGAENSIDNGPIYEGKYRVRYFDNDGIILKIEYVEKGGKTTPPANPSYDPEYLIFAEWNYDTDNYIVEQPTDIGAIYNTVDDITYMFCRFTTSTGLNPTLNISHATSIDWGDGTVDTNLSHTYTNEGEYIIKIYGGISFVTSASLYLLGSSSLNKSLQKFYIKNGVISISDRLCYSCANLTNISIPQSCGNTNYQTFTSCYVLKSIIIPKKVTKIYSNMCYYNESIRNIIIPEKVTTIEGDAFYVCYGLTNVSIPKSVTSIGSGTFRNCRSLTSITIPKSVISIGNYAFESCYALTNYFIDCDTVPTLSGTGVFNNINKSTIFWVNDSIIEQLKVATNWSTYVSYMKPRSWYPSLTNPNE